MLSEKLGMKTSLRQVRIGEEHLAQLAADSMKQQRLPVNNPCHVGETGALAVYRAAL